LQQLNVATEEVEELLIGLILEGKVEGRIDQVGMRLELDKKCVIFPYRAIVLALTFLFRQSLEKKRYGALEKWIGTLEAVHGAIVGKIGIVGRDFGSVEGFGSSMKEVEWITR
jgi:COP9 signalosome complex subunit 2